MLALPEMVVVFVPKEKITLGRWEHLTAEEKPKSYRYGFIPESATVTKFNRNIKVERGKPLKRET